MQLSTTTTSPQNYSYLFIYFLQLFGLDAYLELSRLLKFISCGGMANDLLKFITWINCCMASDYLQNKQLIIYN